MLRYSTYVGKLLVDRFEVRQMLGEGGMGQVFLAYDRQTRENKAVKLVDTRKRKYPLETVLRFKAEAETLESLRHPGIVRYEGFFSEDDIYALVTEYVQWQTLAEVLLQKGPLPIKTILKLLAETVQALLFIHERDYVHHDLKPSNLMVCLEKEEGIQVKILDFGFSQLVGSQEDPQGGTLAYMAPEQTGILHKIIDHRADMYSLGIMVYEALTGQVPFSGRDAADILHQHVARVPVAPIQLREEVPQVLNAMVMRLLAKDPEDRYRTTSGLLKDIEKYLRLAKEQETLHVDFPLGLEDHYERIPTETPFVGRERMMEEMLKIITKTGYLQDSAVVLIDGNQGVGKTRLLTELHNNLQKQSIKVWFTTKRREVQETPFSSLRNLLRHFLTYLKALNETDQYVLIHYIQKSFGARYAKLVSLLPDLAQWSSMPEGMEYREMTGNENGDEYAEVLADFLVLIARRVERLILLVDDFQYTDAASAKCLTHIRKKMRGVSIMFFFAFQRDQLSDSLLQFVESCQTGQNCFQKFLWPLDEVAVGHLLREMFSDRLVDLPVLLNPLFEKSHGNPQRLRSLLQVLIDQKLLQTQQQSWRCDVPATLKFLREHGERTSTEALLAGLSARQSEMILRGASFQRAFDFMAIKSLNTHIQPVVPNHSDEELLVVLDQLVSQGVLSCDYQQLYAFRNPELRQYFLEQMNPEFRSALHQAIADYLRGNILPKAHESIYDIAHHQSKTDNHQQTLSTYLQAAKLTENNRFNNPQSYYYYNLAMELLRKLPHHTVDSQLQFSLRYGYVQHDCHFNNDFPRQYEEVQQMKPFVEGDVHRQVKLLRIESFMLFLLNRKEEMFQKGELLLELATDPRDHPHAVQIYNMMGRVASDKTFLQRKELLQNGINMALQHNMVEQVGVSLAVCTTMMAYQAEFQEAEKFIAEVTDRFAQLDYRTAQFFRCLAFANLETLRGDFSTQFEYAKTLEQNPDLFGNFSQRIFLINKARTLGMTGRIKEASSLFERLKDQIGNLETGLGSVILLQARIEVALKMEDPESALQFYHSLRELLKTRVDRFEEAMAAIHAAQAFLMQANTEEAEQMLKNLARPLVEQMDSELLRLMLEFFECKLRWFQNRDEQALTAAEQVLQRMAERQITGYYESYKEDLKHWSRLTSDSSSSYMSSFRGNSEILQLMEINRRITATLEIDVLFEEVLAGAMKITGAEEAYLFTNCQQLDFSQPIPPKLSQNSEGNPIPAEDWHYSQSIIARVVKNRRSLLTRDARSEYPWRDEASIQKWQLRSILVTPILSQEAIIGVIYLDNHHASSVFTNKDLEITEIFATQVAIAINNAASYNKEQQARKQVEATLQVFERFVPSEFTKRFADGDIHSLKAGLNRSETITVLFSDVRGFTTLSEALGTEQTFSFLNNYLYKMEALIREHHGFVDKFIGDGIMALFDCAPADAVRAGMAMHRELQTYNSSKYCCDNTRISIGLGINSGEVMIGVIGSEERMDTTVLGDTVNTASRVESLTKYYGCPLLITESTYHDLLHKDEFLVRFIDSVKVSGKRVTKQLYEVFNIDEKPLQEKKLRFQRAYLEAFDAYRMGLWDDAEQLFDEYIKAFPEDTVAQRIVERCRILRTMPPERWEGVYTLEHK